MTDQEIADPIGQLVTDGRDLDPRLAAATGLGSDQRPDPTGPDRPMPGAGQPRWGQVGRLKVPERRKGTRELVPTYYDQPIVKAPPWGAQVSSYVIAGGVAGTAAALSGAIELLAPEQLRPLARVSAPLAFVSGSVGAVLLLSDLGRPFRALNMLRVFRPTSVMNVGAYFLSATTGAAAVSTVLAGRPGILGTLGRAAAVAGGATGIPLAGYTGVLLSATAQPGWNIGARTLPPLFLTSGAATSASLLRLAPVGGPGQAAVGVMAVTSQAGELLAGRSHEKALVGRPVIQRCYDSQPGWRYGKYLTAASLVLGLAPTRKHLAGRIAAGLLGVAGSVATKQAVFQAGIDSAANPLAVTEAEPVG